jgi:hypothetical protein
LQGKFQNISDEDLTAILLAQTASHQLNSRQSQNNATTGSSANSNQHHSLGKPSDVPIITSHGAAAILDSELGAQFLLAPNNQILDHLR